MQQQPAQQPPQQPAQSQPAATSTTTATRPASSSSSSFQVPPRRRRRRQSVRPEVWVCSLCQDGSHDGSSRSSSTGGDNKTSPSLPPSGGGPPASNSTSHSASNSESGDSDDDDSAADSDDNSADSESNDPAATTSGSGTHGAASHLGSHNHNQQQPQQPQQPQFSRNQYQKSSGRSIRAHFRECFRRRYPETATMLVAELDELIHTYEQRGEIKTGLKSWLARKPRRIITSIPDTERWTCPVCSLKSFKTTSSQSIRRHQETCGMKPTRTHLSAAAAPPSAATAAAVAAAALSQSAAAALSQSAATSSSVTSGTSSFLLGKTAPPIAIKPADPGASGGGLRVGLPHAAGSFVTTPLGGPMAPFPTPAAFPPPFAPPLSTILDAALSSTSSLQALLSATLPAASSSSSSSSSSSTSSPVSSASASTTTSTPSARLFAGLPVFPSSSSSKVETSSDHETASERARKRVKVSRSVDIIDASSLISDGDSSSGASAGAHDPRLLHVPPHGVAGPAAAATQLHQLQQLLAAFSRNSPSSSSSSSSSTTSSSSAAPGPAPPTTNLPRQLAAYLTSMLTGSGAGAPPSTSSPAIVSPPMVAAVAPPPAAATAIMHPGVSLSSPVVLPPSAQPQALQQRLHHWLPLGTAVDHQARSESRVASPTIAPSAGAPLPPTTFLNDALLSLASSLASTEANMNLVGVARSQQPLWHPMSASSAFASYPPAMPQAHPQLNNSYLAYGTPTVTPIGVVPSVAAAPSQQFGVPNASAGNPSITSFDLLRQLLALQHQVISMHP